VKAATEMDDTKLLAEGGFNDSEWTPVEQSSKEIGFTAVLTSVIAAAAQPASERNTPDTTAG
jgi:hypothetical protein